jgi:Ca2+-binding RTX toxin-like protein
MTIFTGTSGNDTIAGTEFSDSFDLTQGGNDTVTGAGGNDIFQFGATFTAADSVDGGLGQDQVTLDGDYTGAAALVLSSTTMTNVENLILAAGHSYSITTDDATIGAGALLAIHADALGTGDSLMLNGSAETNARFSISASAGLNVITGGAFGDTIYFDNGRLLNSADQIDGGGGGNDLYLNGDYSAGLILDPTTITHIDHITLAGSFMFNIVTDDANFTPGFGTDSVVDASGIGTGGSLIWDASAETDRAFSIIACAGFNMIIGGAQSDTIFFNNGFKLTAGDRIDGGGGNDLVSLQGDYSAGLKFSAATLQHIETLTLSSGYSYKLTERDANVASGKTLTIDSSALLASDSLVFDGSAETDGKLKLSGGAGSDTIKLNAANFLGDNVAGGTGAAIDKLILTTAATLTAANLTSHMSHVEQLSLAAATNSVALSDAVIASTDDNRLLTVFGNSGNDTIDASLVSNVLNRIAVTAGSGNDALSGGAGADLFIFTSADLTSLDQVNGGAGAALDVLSFSSGGALASDALAQVSHIEQILLGGGNHTLTLTDTQFSTADDGGLVQVTGNSGNDTIDASTVSSAAYALYVIAGAGNDTFAGGSEADTFSFNASDVSSLDSVNGGTGVALDRLILASAGNVSSFNTMSHIEQIVLANGNNSLTLTDALVTSADDGHLLTVFGGTGNDTVNALSVNTGNNAVWFVAGNGNDTFVGGGGADTVEVSAAGLSGTDNFNGSSGNDTLFIDTAGALTSNALSHVSHVETIRLSAGTNSLVIVSSAITNTDGGVLTVLGNSGADTVDASSNSKTTGSVIFDGGGGADVLNGGSEGDTFRYAGVADSTGNASGTAYDTLGNFDTATDSIDLAPGFTVNTSIGNVASGALSSATFDTDMGAAVGGALTSQTAVVFHANSGTLAGHVFLVVNPTGSNGYVSGADYVFDITGFSGAISSGDFI